MAAEEIEWAPLYVMGAGYKKLNGAYVNGGVYEDSPRYKNPNQPIWVFNVPEKGCWCFGNKARYLEDQTKMLYKCQKNFEGGDPIPTSGWKKGQPPGSGKPPKLICTAFSVDDEVLVWSKKGKKWVDGKISVVDGAHYKVLIVSGKKKRGRPKPLKIPRPQLRTKGDTKFTSGQFVEVKSKKGDWLPALVGGVKDEGKYSIILPEGKCVTFPEARIRPSEMCRLDGDEDEAAAPAPAAEAAPAATTSAASIPAASSGGGSSEQVAQLTAQVVQLSTEKAQLQAQLAAMTVRAETAEALAQAAASGGAAPSAGGATLDPVMTGQIKMKQAEMLGLLEQIMGLQEQLGF